MLSVITTPVFGVRRNGVLDTRREVRDHLRTIIMRIRMVPMGRQGLGKAASSE